MAIGDGTNINWYQPYQPLQTITATTFTWPLADAEQKALERFRALAKVAKATDDDAVLAAVARTLGALAE